MEIAKLEEFQSISEVTDICSSPELPSRVRGTCERPSLVEFILIYFGVWKSSYNKTEFREKCMTVGMHPNDFCFLKIVL
jgi:hypothetical protein